ncbi:hypothetical protein DFP72DRAFT_536113 [Ephemerocybe angulata]|uniref:C2H2-type domain-containing protein n=1 Tax=Ephemerocybe angulata TaxID=980116 RepID=A0A8H6HMG3_9AGAR|nr:hypothetical protein DFP72DRAFT_536113 [Tulosesus angulatus]
MFGLSRAPLLKNSWRNIISFPLLFATARPPTVNRGARRLISLWCKMFSVEAIPGVSIVIRSKDPNFSPENMVFVTEYSGMGGGQPSAPVQLSILKEADQNGQLIRISVMNPNSASAGRQKATLPISPVSSYENMTRIPSPSSTTYPANPHTGYPSPSPSLVHQIPFPSSDAGSSHTSSSSNQSDILDFSDFAFGEALSNFQDAFPSNYGDLSSVLGGAGSSSSDQLRSSQQYYSTDSLINSSSYSIPSTSSFLTTAPMIHDLSPLSPTSHSNPLATPLVSSPCSLSDDDSNQQGSSSSSSNTFPLPLVSSSSSSTSSNLPDQNDPKRIYTCRHEGCEKRFARKYHRQVHENSHKPKIRLLLTCREVDCSAKFGRPHDRMRHEVAKHGLRPNFVCNECGKFFGTESKLRGHKCDLMPSQRHRWTEPGPDEI